MSRNHPIIFIVEYSNMSADLSKKSYYLVSFLISADLSEIFNYIVSFLISADLSEKSN